MGARNVFALNRAQSTSGPSRPSEIYVIDSNGTARSIDIEPLNLVSAALVPLDDTRLGVVAIGSDNLNSWLSYRIVDIVTQSIQPETKLTEIAPAFPAVPQYSYIESIAAIGANDGIYAAWVTGQRTAIRL